MEKFQFELDLNGWYLMPENPKNCPLLRELHGLEGDSFEYLELPPTIDWDSVEEGMVRIREIAFGMGMTVQFCGNLKKRPIGILRKKPGLILPEPVKVFEGMGMDSAKWGVSDFYDEEREALKAAIASGEAFDTKWYSVKKEIQSGRVRRERYHGPIHIEISCAMDEDRDLVDTAFWRAAGGNPYCGSGWEALAKHGLTESEIDQVIDEMAEANELGEDNCAYRDTVLHWKCGFDKVCDTLDELCDQAEKELNNWYESTVESCKWKLEVIRDNRESSCKNCKLCREGAYASAGDYEYAADCRHPKHGVLLTRNPHFPFERGCKFWEAKKQPAING